MSFTILPGLALPKSKYLFSGLFKNKQFTNLDNELEIAEFHFNAKEYISICLFSAIVYFFLLTIFLFVIFFKIELEPTLLIAIVFSFFISLYFILNGITYPKRINSMNGSNIDRNIMPALEDFLIQLYANVPLYKIMVNVGKGNYGRISVEFNKAVALINSGEDEIFVLEEMARKNPSKLFRRVLWQIINSLKSGTQISDSINDSINSLSEIQESEIQKYGSSLSGIIVFYMLIAVVVPTLSITFFIVLSIFFSVSDFYSIIILSLLYLAVLFFEILFLGMLRIKRPKLI